MPDENNFANLQALIESSRGQIATAVHFACRKYNHGAPSEEVEELTEEIIVLLLEDNCRRLRTFDCAKSKLTTWLNKVVANHVQHHYQHKREFLWLDQLLPNQFSYPATQEKELLKEEQRKLIQTAINELSPHDQVIAKRKLQEISDEDIAKQLQIKPASVAREWRVIKTKLAQRLANESQSKAKQSKAK